MDPVGLSALLEALKARVTSVLKFEGAEVIYLKVTFLTEIGIQRANRVSSLYTKDGFRGNDSSILRMLAPS